MAGRRGGPAPVAAQTLFDPGGFMRLRVAAIVLTAAWGTLAPVRAAESAADLNKFLPEGSGFYVRVNVRQCVAAPVVRKAIPMAVDKYGDTIMQLAQLAKA